MTDQNRDPAMAEKLKALVEGQAHQGADGFAGMRAILREIEAIEPGAIERMAAGLQLNRLRRTVGTVQ